MSAAQSQAVARQLDGLIKELHHQAALIVMRAAIQKAKATQ